MLTRRAILAAPAVLMFPRHVAAAPAEPPIANQAAEVANASVHPVQDSGAITDRMEAFIDSSGLGARADRNELFILRGVSVVQVPTTNPDWVRYRQIAYSDALLSAQADFVAEQNTHIMARTVGEFYKSANEQPPPYDDTRAPGKAAELLRKIVAVASGKLDNELRGIGIDPAEYAKTPEPQRTPLLAKHLKTQTLERSIGDTIGLCPIQTFEAWDSAGTTRIGVVAVCSGKMRDFAQQVLHMRGEFTPDPGRAQDLRKLFADTSKLVSEFGVRRLFDSQGLPVVISFAQWASPYRGNDPALAADYNESALQQASLLADHQIADFLKGSIEYRKQGAVGQEIDRIASSMPDSTGSIEDTKRIVDQLSRQMIRTASIQIAGERTLRTWSGRHQAVNLPIVGVIRMWSAATEQALHARQSPHTNAPSGLSPGAAGAAQGRRLMNADDF